LLPKTEKVPQTPVPKTPGTPGPKNINVTSAYLHVLGDLLMSVGVIIAAVIIYFRPDWTIADPICTYLFSVIIMCTSIPVFKDCILVLMEGTPGDVDVEQLEQDISDIPLVDEVHDLHLWSISSGKHALSIHIVSSQPLKALNMVTDLCRRKYKLYHTTIQVEGPQDSKHFFNCENDLH
jgi:zinc transporter 2